MEGLMPNFSESSISSRESNINYIRIAPVSFLAEILVDPAHPSVRINLLACPNNNQPNKVFSEFKLPQTVIEPPIFTNLRTTTFAWTISYLPKDEADWNGATLKFTITMRKNGTAYQYNSKLPMLGLMENAETCLDTLQGAIGKLHIQITKEESSSSGEAAVCLPESGEGGKEEGGDEEDKSGGHTMPKKMFANLATEPERPQSSGAGEKETARTKKRFTKKGFKPKEPCCSKYQI